MNRPVFPSPISLRRLRAWVKKNGAVLERRNDRVLCVSLDGWRNLYQFNKFAKPHPQGLYWWFWTEKIGWMAEAAAAFQEANPDAYKDFLHERR